MSECEKCDGNGRLMELCFLCNGSGEGMHEGTTCRACKGMGEVAEYCDACDGEVS